MNIVICDICNEDYTHRDDTGGFIFGSYAYCPQCAKQGMERIMRYNEEDHITAICPKGKSFRQFILEKRI